MKGILEVILRNPSAAYAPGEEIGGAVKWNLEREPSSAKVKLCWFTRGKGTEDSAVVETINFDLPQISDQRNFGFRAPLEPYSFSGRLISLIWAVELVIEPGKLFQRAEIIIGPGRKEVILPTVAKT